MYSPVTHHIGQWVCFIVVYSCCQRDPFHNSIYVYDFNNGAAATVECYHYSDIPKDDHLKITINSKEFRKYKTHKAEKVNN